jgi:DNA-binding response OmpR family regulator
MPNIEQGELEGAEGMRPADYRSRRRCRLLNILAVEDDKAVAQFLALVLGGPNCKVATANNGEKALAKIDAAKKPFDVVITDHRMPRVSGLQLVRELRARKFGGKVVVLSAHLGENNIKAYQELGVDSLISKPFDVDELRKTIDALDS